MCAIGSPKGAQWLLRWLSFQGRKPRAVELVDIDHVSSVCVLASHSSHRPGVALQFSGSARGAVKSSALAVLDVDLPAFERRMQTLRFCSFVSIKNLLGTLLTSLPKKWYNNNCWTRPALFHKSKLHFIKNASRLAAVGRFFIYFPDGRNRRRGPRHESRSVPRPDRPGEVGRVLGLEGQRCRHSGKSASKLLLRQSGQQFNLAVFDLGLAADADNVAIQIPRGHRIALCRSVRNQPAKQQAHQCGPRHSARPGIGSGRKRWCQPAEPLPSPAEARSQQG